MLNIQPRRESMFRFVAGMKGNERACIWTEPLWGTPHELVVPFASVYMAALGLTALQIGLISTLTFISQVIGALLSGALADKMGRKNCTIVWDVCGWILPCALWALARDMRFFVAAALLNGAYRVTENSWSLLMTEDAPQERYVRLFAATSIAGLLSGFVAPIPYVFVRRFGIVPTMRALYWIFFAMMLLKGILLYVASRETNVGKIRREACRGQSLLLLLRGNGALLGRMLRDRRARQACALLFCYTAVKNIGDTFWPLLLTGKLGVETESLSLFSTARALLMLGSYLFVAPRLRVNRFKRPMLAGVAALGAVELMLLLLPPGAPRVFLWAGLVVEALSLSIIYPLVEALRLVSIDARERARMAGLMLASCLLVTSPFSTLAGALSDVNRSLPFALNLLILVFAFALTLRADGVREE